MIQGGKTYRIITDQLGSPRAVVDTSNGAVAQAIDYDEFGRVLSDSAPGFQPFGFAGGLYDRNTGLVRFGARDYDPEIGRFTSQGPARVRRRRLEPVRVRAGRPDQPRRPDRPVDRHDRRRHLDRVRRVPDRQGADERVRREPVTDVAALGADIAGADHPGLHRRRRDGARRHAAPTPPRTWCAGTNRAGELTSPLDVPQGHHAGQLGQRDARPDRRTAVPDLRQRGAQRPGLRSAPRLGQLTQSLVDEP